MELQANQVQYFLDNQVKTAIDKEVEKIEEEIRKKLPAMLIKIRQEIFQSYKLITGTIVESVFYHTYGDVFDLSALQHSLIYYPAGNGLKPTMSYNSNIFRFNDKFFKEMNKFNQNSRNWERKNRKYLNPSFYTDSGSFSDYYENFYDDIEMQEYEEQGLDEYDYMDDLLMDYEGMVKASKRNPAIKVNLDDTYKRAISKANQGFEREWNRSIKPRLAKKYNINF